MLPKKSRISKKDFPHIISTGKRYNSLHLLLQVAKNTGESSKKSNIAFSVSKKVAKLASSRNTYRRRGYSVLRKHLKAIQPGYFLSFSFKKDPSALSSAHLEKEVVELLYASGVLI